uniref:Uncharacterized protein n=1 Tax=Triticum urartu TaxID=4572 RepID=A0A8R7PXG9_TRIUA
MSCKPGAVSYNSTLKGSCRAERWKEAEEILQLLLAGGSLLIKECTIFCCKEKSQLQQRII